MPWLVSMSRLDRFNIISSYDRWAEEVQALLSLSNVQKAITEKGTQGDDVARGIIMLSLDRDLRDYMSGKVAAGTAADLWNGIKKAKYKLVSSWAEFIRCSASYSSSKLSGWLGGDTDAPTTCQTVKLTQPYLRLRTLCVTTGRGRESCKGKISSRYSQE